VDRIVDVFPGEDQQQIRVMLAESLKGVVAQRLLARKGGKGRVAAFEILKGTPAISAMIREGKTFQIASAMQIGRKDGMISLDQYLSDLVTQGRVDQSEASLHMAAALVKAGA
jgi:twitching motility protein PilT